MPSNEEVVTNWPEPMQHDENCNRANFSYADCNCGADKVNEMRDKFMQALSQMPVKNELEPLDENRVLEEISNLKYHSPKNGWVRVFSHPESCLKLAQTILSKFGTRPHDVPSVEEIERIIWKYCTPFYEKDIQGHTHTVKGDDLAIAIQTWLKERGAK